MDDEYDDFYSDEDYFFSDTEATVELFLIRVLDTRAELLLE
jgi:hypothetical protein